MPGPMWRNDRRRCGCWQARFLHNLTCGRKDARNLEGTRYRTRKEEAYDKSR